MSSVPLLLLDVDGVLNPLGRRTRGYRRYEVTLDDETYTVFLDRRHGAKLLALAEETGAELVWATTWEHRANEWIAPRVGLPSLPVIELRDDSPVTSGEMFKTPHVAGYVRGRPFVWFDDALWAGDQRYLEAHPDVGDFLLVEVDQRAGLTDDHLDLARAWLMDLRRDDAHGPQEPHEQGEPGGPGGHDDLGDDPGADLGDGAAEHPEAAKIANSADS